MSKPSRKTIRLQQMRAQRAQAAKLAFVDLIFERADGTEETVTFPTPDNWPVELFEKTKSKDDDGNLAALREVASPQDAFDRLLNVAKLTFGELSDLITEMSEEAGTDQGEDSGSSTSSESTPGASAPTSSATTPAVA